MNCIVAELDIFPYPHQIGMLSNKYDIIQLYTPIPLGHIFFTFSLVLVLLKVKNYNLINFFQFFTSLQDIFDLFRKTKVEQEKYQSKNWKRV